MLSRPFETCIEPQAGRGRESMPPTSYPKVYTFRPKNRLVLVGSPTYGPIAVGWQWHSHGRAEVSTTLVTDGRAMSEETIFANALEKTGPDERAAYLDAACAGDPALRQRVA